MWNAQRVSEQIFASPEWAALAAESTALASSPAWLKAWCAAFARPDDRLDILEYREGGRLCAVAPLVRAGGLVRRRRFPFNPHVPAADFMLRPGHESGAVVELLEHLAPHTDAFSLGCISHETPLYRELKRLGERGLAHLAFDEQPGAAVIDATGGWDAYAKTRSKKNLDNFQRKQRQLAREGELDFTVHPHPPFDVDLAECFAIEQASWKGALGSAIGQREHTRRFYEVLAAEAAAAGTLVLRRLRLNGRMVAFDYGVLSGDRLYSLKISYDPEMSRFSPGQILQMHSIRAAFEDPRISSVHLGLPSPTKDIWSTRVEPTSALHVYLSHSRATLAYMLGPALKSGIKSIPAAQWVMEKFRARRTAAKEGAKQPSQGAVGEAASPPTAAADATVNSPRTVAESETPGSAAITRDPDVHSPN